MKQFLLVFFLSVAFAPAFSQTDSLLNSLQTQSTTQQDLFPKKMLFTQRLAWGEHGFLRGSSTVTPEVRMHDMKIRRRMLIAHQLFGVATMAGMIGQAIIGPKLYNDPGNLSLKQTHERVALAVNTTYSLTALMSLFAPPPMVQRDKGITSIRLHKWLAIVHLSGMIATNILASKLEDNPSLKPYHRAAAYTTFASFAAAMLVIKI
jgi:hypothetical protein